MKGIVRSLSWKSVAGPTAFAVVAIALLIYDHLNRRVTELVFWLTLALIVAVFWRMIETLRRQSGALRTQERSALSDPVTGLDNRHKLEADLAWATTSGSQWALVLVELDGMQVYSDRFGYAAGEELLRRAALGLLDAVVPLEGAAYRVDGARLAALAPCGARGGDELVLAATTPPREAEGESVLGRSYGEVVIPDEAADAETALQIAGQRLDGHRQRQQRSARRQAHAVLMAALSARRPELRDHLRGVTYRAISLARRLGAGVAEIDDIALASELQEVGLLALPESALREGAPLTVEGERIVAAAPGLKEVAGLVRSSSERFDGSGHPDGLAGERIPLGSRIIAVSVAFAEMTARRPDRAGMAPGEALAELRRRAGTQLDPSIVEALAEELAEEPAAAPAPA
jgi:two-component system cell cycle response regulator